MSNYKLLADKKKALHLEIDDHIIVDNDLWRVVNNFRVVGGAGQMLMLAYHTHVDPQGFMFHQVRSDERFEVFQPIE